MTTDQTLRELTQAQHGLATRGQLFAAGMTRKELGVRLRNGTLAPVTPTVVRLAGAQRTQAQRALAAVMEAGDGGCLSHESAAAYWGVQGFRLEPLHVWRVRDRSSHPNRVGIQHKSRRLPGHHVTELDGVKVTTPTRVVFDLAAVLPFGKTARVLDNVWARRLTTWPQLRDMFEELRGRGRAGTRHMRILLNERGADYRPPESNVERRFHKLAFDANVGDFDRQVDISGPEGWIARVDFLHKSLPLIVEVDGDRWHTSLTDREADQLRDRALRAAGYWVVRVTEFEVWHRPHDALDRVRAAEAELGVEARPKWVRA